MAGDCIEMKFETFNKITLAEDGVSFANGSEILFSLMWHEVREIVAYKEDCFGVDSICIGFRIEDSEKYPRVFEEAEGYKEMLSELERRFPDIRKDWFNEAAFPAFVPNWTTIWGTPFSKELK